MAKGALDNYIDESIAKHGEPIEYTGKPFTGTLAPGFTVEEIEYDEYLAAVEEMKLMNLHAEREKGDS